MLIVCTLSFVIFALGVGVCLSRRRSLRRTAEEGIFRPRFRLDVHSSPLLNPPHTAPLASAHYLVLDTETFDAISPSVGEEVGEFVSPLVALSWMITDRSGRPIRERSMVVCQTGRMHEEAIGIHGISNERMQQGIAPSDALEALWQDLDLAQTIVAHNARFHLSVLHHEAERCGYSTTPLAGKPYLCTMLWGKDLGCKVNAAGVALYPNVCELFAYLYFGALHLPIHYESKTLRDIRLCRACLCKMLRR